MEQNLISLKDFQTHFSLYVSDTCDIENKDIILNNCIKLFKKDYNINLISNENNILCTTYPKKLIIVQLPKENENKINNIRILSDLMDKSKNARVRSRIPVPVIFYNGKNVSRSSTLAQKIECVAKSAQQNFSISKALNFLWTPKNSNYSSDNIIEESRCDDIGLIKAQNIKFICDLMVEDKKWKYGIYVSSSEKTDRHARYANFCITSIPYPGTEFFCSWHNNNYKDDMSIDWNEFGTDSTELTLDPEAPTAFYEKDWKLWNINELTQNYLKQILTYLSSKEDGGVLIHCISGWDRTPLYISLIRISLWADGVIHNNLSAIELLYLTVNYDWFLFNHNLPDRTSRGEDIFYFCFCFLSKITTHDYSIQSISEHVRYQKHSESQKISIKNTEDDDSLSGSFGSCGRSWEMTGVYMNSCSFIKDSSIQQNISELTTSQSPEIIKPEKSPKRKEIETDNSDDFFNLDDEDSFCIVDSMDDETSEYSITTPRNINDTPRAKRLLEVQQIMLEIYSKCII